MLFTIRNKDQFWNFVLGLCNQLYFILWWWWGEEGGGPERYIQLVKLSLLLHEVME